MPKGTMTTFVSKRQSPEEQAKEIWAKEVQPLLNQGKNVGLLYAANQGQSDKINKNYEDGKTTSIDPKTGKIEPSIDGENQAEIFAKLNEMIAAKNLQDKVHILPIATSLRGGDNVPGNQVNRTQIDKDLDNVASHVANGWEIRGMGRPENSNEYAIGGGKSKGWLDPNNAKINGVSQGKYVEDRLQTIATKPVHEWPDSLRLAGLKNPPLMTTKHQSPLSTPLSTEETNTALEQLEAESAKKKKEEATVFGRDNNALIKAFDKQFSADPFYKQPANKPEVQEDGSINMKFKSPEDLEAFAVAQADAKPTRQSFIMIDEATKKVLAYSNGKDGEVYNGDGTVYDAEKQKGQFIKSDKQYDSSFKMTQPETVATKKETTLELQKETTSEQHTDEGENEKLAMK